MADDTRARFAADLIKSLDSVIQIMLGEEMKTIRDAIKGAEYGLVRRMDEFEKETKKNSEALKREMNARIDELSKSVEKGLLDQASAIKRDTNLHLDEMVKAADKRGQDQAGAIKSMEGKLTATAAQLTERTDRMSKELTQTSAALETIREDATNHLAFAQTRIDEEMEAVRGQVQSLATQHQANAAELKRVSMLLSGLSKIFSDQTGGQEIPQVAQAAAPKPAAPSPAQPAARKAPAGQSKKAEAAPARAAGDDAESLPNANDLSDHMDSMFKLDGKK